MIGRSGCAAVEAGNSCAEPGLGILALTLPMILNEWKRHNLMSRLSGYYCLENKARLQSESEL